MSKKKKPQTLPELYHETVLVQKESTAPPNSITDGTEIYRGTDKTFIMNVLKQSTNYSLGTYKYPVILKEQICKYIHDPDALWLINSIIDSTNGDGIPIGNQSSQTFAVYYLNGLDHLIKDQLGIKYYGRYMDDFFIIHHDKEKLKEYMKIISKTLADLGLTLNNKTQIFPIKNGIDFLGFHTYLTESGKVIRKVRRRSKNNMQHKLKKMNKLYQEGKIDKDSIQNSYQSWKGYAKHGNSYHLLQKTDAYFEHIFQEKE